MSVVLLGQPIVVINSYKHAYELLEKRSAIYSDRPHMIMAGDIVGWDQILVLLRYGSQFREYRRLMARVLGSRKNVESFVPIIEEHTGRLLCRLLREPTADLPSQIRKYVPNISLRCLDGACVSRSQPPNDVLSIDLRASQHYIFTQALHRMTGATVLMISYGYQAQEHDDPLIKIAEEATEQAAEVAQPCAFFVDVFPFRKCRVAGYHHTAVH